MVSAVGVVGRSAADSDAWSAWTESADPASDLAPCRMAASAAAPPPMAYVEVLVSTPAGKPVAHFAHGRLPGASADAPKFHRPPAQRYSLSAASVAFAAVAPSVRSVTTPAGVLFFASTHSLHVVATSSDPRFPTPVLAALARLAVGFLTASLSANLVTTLAARPHFDVTPHLEPFSMHLTTLLGRALANPLVYASLTPPALPCPTTPASRSAVCDILRSAMGKAPASLCHALILTACPPFPRKLVAVASPLGCAMTPLDLLILTSMLPEVSDAESRADGGKSASTFPKRIFLQCSGHSVPYAVSASLVELRLHAEDYEAFHAVVGSDTWRPDWDPSGGDSVWAVAIAKTRGQHDGEKAAAICVADIERALDKSRAARDVITAIERPWIVNDIPDLRAEHLRGLVKGIVVLSADRLAGTPGACDHELGLTFTRALLASGWAVDPEVGDGCRVGSQQSGSSPSEIWRVLDVERGLQVFGRRRLVMAAMDIATPGVIGENVFVNSIVPWENKYRRSLLPDFDRVVLPIGTMLGGLLAPFPET